MTYGDDDYEDAWDASDPPAAKLAVVARGLAFLARRAIGDEHTRLRLLSDHIDSIRDDIGSP